MLSLIIIAVSVAADATAVAIAASVRGINFARALTMAFAFGAAQAFMAGLGWFGGAFLEARFAAWDHWVALVLLSIVGLKMIKEAFDDDEEREPIVAGFASLLVLTVATSIDALAVGVSLPTLQTGAAISLTLIGLVTFLFTAAGAAFGRFLGERFGRAMEVAGGVALIVIGIHIVIEHTR